MRHLVLATALLWLSACASVPLGSTLKLSRFDFQTTDIGAMRVAVRLPRNLEVPEGKALLEMRIGADGDPAQTVETFQLEVDGSEREAAELDGFSKPDVYLQSYRIAAADLPGLQRLRERLADAGGRAATKSISVRVDGCRRAALSAGPLVVSIYLKVSEVGEYVPLVSDADLGALSGRQVAGEQIPPCRPDAG